MLDELREDFDRWWVTATFQEKASMALSASFVLLILGSILIPRSRS